MARYAGSIFVRYEVPEELKEYLTPKLVLQPLVENSIMHAMQESNHTRCEIRILAEKDGRDILLRVIDDGEAMTQRKAEAMNRFLAGGEPADGSWGIGISNVNDRVAMSFGEGYGLRYARVNGETIATIRIRAMKEGGRHADAADCR